MDTVEHHDHDAADSDAYHFASLAALGTSPSVLGLSTISSYDEYSNDPRFVESQRELRDLLFTSAHSLAPTRAASPEADLTGSLLPRIGVDEDAAISKIVSTGPRVAWLRNYLDEVAPWLDMFDAAQHFGRVVPIFARSSVSLAFAMLAISARQMERKEKLRGDLDSLQLYQEAIGGLTPQLLASDPGVLATCVILCVLEMMSASPWNWQKHLDGCAALFSSYSIHGFSGGLPQAVFWCYARMDVCAAIICSGNSTLVLDLKNWLPPGVPQEDASHYFLAAKMPDMWANYAVYLAARSCHLVWQRTNATPAVTEQPHEDQFTITWRTLWVELQAWRQNRPLELLEISFGEESRASQDGPFPFVLFAASCAISSNQLYHAACLILLDIKPFAIERHQLGHQGSKLWHARRICGISTTNEHHGCLNNAIQPLWLAGKLLSHPVEQKAVVNLIKTIENTTGWSVQWRIGDLKEAWGYDRNASI
ncbi:hypothetical protein BKA61DRAFT_37096 [Leptodontidium sp. MPI-SDFR-AT-0119]|nr:hypothetical protein BKA61DRAFT_37096 [Leptodontidium sp. MPI-SDFR-AT-0119]